VINSHRGRSGQLNANAPIRKLAPKTFKTALANPKYRDYAPRSFFGNLAAVTSVASVRVRKIYFMAVKIRMKRVGTKNVPVFRIVVADGRSPRDGKFIEEIGTYQPLKKDNNFTIDLERVKYWVSKGAQPSDTVASFIKKATKAAPVTA
jgi:small subunit ribosomal protein S16